MPTTGPTKSQKQKVVLAYSGGLDTSVMVKWLQVEKDLDVVAICVNVGQESQDLVWVKQKALDMGAIAAEAVDLRDLYADAADAYAAAITRSGTAADWTLYLQRGGALEQAGRWAEACDAFLLWNKAGWPLKAIRGLTLRRQRERALCLQGVA